MTVTGVLSHFSTENLLRKLKSNNLASISANRLPMQVLGPMPNGMKLPGTIESLLSSLNLDIRVKLLWVGKVRSIAVNVVDGHQN